MENKIKHKLKSNFNLNLDSIQSHLKISEEIDCKTGAVSICLGLTSHEIEIKLEVSYQLGSDYELKYYRNQQMMKHILNGTLIVDLIPNEELVSLMKIDDYNRITNKSIIALDFYHIDKRLVSIQTENRKNRLVIDDLTVTEVSPQNLIKTKGQDSKKGRKEKPPKESTKSQEIKRTDSSTDEEEEEDNDDSRWRFLLMDHTIHKEDQEQKPKETGPNAQKVAEKVGEKVTKIIKGIEKGVEKGIENLDEKDPNKKKNDKKSPLSF